MPDFSSHFWIALSAPTQHGGSFSTVLVNRPKHLVVGAKILSLRKTLLTMPSLKKIRAHVRGSQHRVPYGPRYLWGDGILGVRFSQRLCM